VYADSEFLNKSEHATSLAQSQRRSFFSEFDHFIFFCHFWYHSFFLFRDIFTIFFSEIFFQRCFLALFFKLLKSLLFLDGRITARRWPRIYPIDANATGAPSGRPLQWSHDQQSHRRNGQTANYQTM